MTNPFFLEILVSSDLLPFERPFVTAHEWSHLAGVADEGEANFVGWLACLRGSPAAQYSGWLFMYSELVRVSSRADRAALAAALAAGPREDLQAIRDRVARHVSPQSVGGRMAGLRFLSQGESRRVRGRQLRRGRAPGARRAPRVGLVALRRVARAQGSRVGYKF